MSIAPISQVQEILVEPTQNPLPGLSPLSAVAGVAADGLQLHHSRHWPLCLRATWPWNTCWVISLVLQPVATKCLMCDIKPWGPPPCGGDTFHGAILYPGHTMHVSGGGFSCNCIFCQCLHLSFTASPSHGCLLRTFPLLITSTKIPAAGPISRSLTKRSVFCLISPLFKPNRNPTQILPLLKCSFFSYSPGNDFHSPLHFHITSLNIFSLWRFCFFLSENTDFQILIYK